MKTYFDVFRDSDCELCHRCEGLNPDSTLKCCICLNQCGGEGCPCSREYKGEEECPYYYFKRRGAK